MSENESLKGKSTHEINIIKKYLYTRLSSYENLRPWREIALNEKGLGENCFYAMSISLKLYLLHEIDLVKVLKIAKITVKFFIYTRDQHRVETNRDAFVTRLTSHKNKTLTCSGLFGGFFTRLFSM